MVSALILEEKDVKEFDGIPEMTRNLQSSNGQQGEDEYTINGMVVLSEPGGGKTTYLKHLIYEIISCYKNDISDSHIFEKNGLDKKVNYVPFFVRTRDLTDILNKEELREGNLFHAIIESSISKIINANEDNDGDAVWDFFEENADHRYLLIIDGFEELEDENAEKLLDCINYAYECDKLNRKEDRLIISSRYKEYGYQKLVTFCAEHAIEEKYIKFDNENAIDDCVSNWFDILKKTGRDMHEYFNQMRTTNSDIKNLITTPLELTGLIMLCYTQSYLPTDITVLYRSIIEIWLTYGIGDAAIPFFSLSDIFLELSTIAYYMAELENEKLRISRERIKEIIGNSRDVLRRYYRSNSYVNAASKDEINALIDFWLKRNIFVKNSREEIYEFAHREYQSYLISYAIVNNFIPKDNRKLKRIEYVAEHMENAEDFWDRVIIFLAFMSPDFHDDIIDHILIRLQELDAKKDQTAIFKGIDKYFLSIILQLANAEGFYFADDEYKSLFDELFKSNRIGIMKKSVKGSEIKKMLSNGRKDINTLFLKKTIDVLEKYNTDIEKLKESSKDVKLLESQVKERENVINIIGPIVFHVAWNCDADRDTIKKAFRLYLDNWITMDIIYEIQDSLARYRYNVDRINLIREIGLAAITRTDEPLSDCYMIISMILGFRGINEDDMTSLYKVALNYFNKAENSVNEIDKEEALVIAINIVFLTTWFLQEKEDKKCNCALMDDKGNLDYRLLEDYLACVKKITEYMKGVKRDNIYFRDLCASYRDLCLIKEEKLKEEIKKILFNEDIFRNCLLLCQKEDIVKKADETELSYVFEIISLYPLVSDYLYLNEVRIILSKRIDDIEKCQKTTKMTSRKALYLLKLLIFAGAFDDNGKVNATKLESEIDKIKNDYTNNVGALERSILFSMENYMCGNLEDCQLELLNRYNYEALMKFMDKKIDEL